MNDTGVPNVGFKTDWRYFWIVLLPAPDCIARPKSQSAPPDMLRLMTPLQNLFKGFVSQKGAAQMYRELYDDSQTLSQ